MINPYENNNPNTEKTVNENTNTNPQESEPKKTVETNHEYHMSGNDIPKAEPTSARPVSSQPYVQQNTQNTQQYSNPSQTVYYHQPQQPQYNQNAYQQSSYTWGQQTPPAQPMYGNAQRPQHAAKPKKQKNGTPFGVKVLALVLCCLISAGASVGVMTALIKNGYIGTNNSSDSESAAYTITKIIDNSSSDSDDTTTSTDGVLTRQEIAEKLIPSVVCVQNYQVTSNNYSDYFSNYFGYGYGSDGSNGSGADDSSTEVDPYAEGSGIILSEDGYIATNAHVVDGATSLKVVTSDGTSYEATLVGSDDVSDLAVLKIDATGLTAAEFGSADDLSVGDQVIAVGNPGGSAFASSVTVGYVSALNREITTESGYTMYCIQTDAAINPGNSGGALVNQYGQVIGINSSKIVSTGYEGLGFAIPSDTAQPILTSIINYGYVKDRAALGVSGTYIDSMTAQWYGLSSGMYVASVNSDEANSAGLEKGDVITSIDGTAVTSSTTITSVVTQKKPGDTVTLKVDRALTGEKDIEITVTLTEHVEDTDSSSSSDNNSGNNNNNNDSNGLNNQNGSGRSAKG